MDKQSLLAITLFAVLLSYTNGQEIYDDGLQNQPNDINKRSDETSLDFQETDSIHQQNTQTKNLDELQTLLYMTLLDNIKHGVISKQLVNEIEHLYGDDVSNENRVRSHDQTRDDENNELYVTKKLYNTDHLSNNDWNTATKNRYFEKELKSLPWIFQNGGSLATTGTGSDVISPETRWPTGNGDDSAFPEKRSAVYGANLLQMRKKYESRVLQKYRNMLPSNNRGRFNNRWG